VGKKGDSTDCLRLASVVAEVVMTVVRHLPGGMGPFTTSNLSELVAKSVSRHFKVEVSAHCLFANIFSKGSAMSSMQTMSTGERRLSTSTNASTANSKLPVPLNSAKDKVAPAPHTSSQVPGPAPGSASGRPSPLATASNIGQAAGSASSRPSSAASASTSVHAPTQPGGPVLSLASALHSSNINARDKHD